MADLLDTNVVSEARRSHPSPAVTAYFRMRARSAYLSVITFAEIEFGLRQMPLSKKRIEIADWLENDLRVVFRGRTLDVTEPILLRWRTMMEVGRKMGRTYSQPDLLLAATALEYGLTLVTRNTKDFTGMSGLQVFNPWEPTA